MQEIWAPVPGYKGHYEVSNLGRVKSLKAKGGATRMLKPSRVGGYPMVNLTKNGKGMSFYVARLVLLAFCGPAPKGMRAITRTKKASDASLANVLWGVPSMVGRGPQKAKS